MKIELPNSIINTLNNAILTKLHSKFDKLSKAILKEFKPESELEILIGTIQFGAKIASKLGISQEGFVSLCKQSFKDLNVNATKAN